MVYIVVLQMPCADKSAKFNGAVSCGATHAIKWFDKIRGVVFSVLCSSRFTRLGPRSVAPLPKRPYTTYSFCARVATYIVWTIGIDTQKKYNLVSKSTVTPMLFVCLRFLFDAPRMNPPKPQQSGQNTVVQHRCKHSARRDRRIHGGWWVRRPLLCGRRH